MSRLVTAQERIRIPQQAGDNNTHAAVRDGLERIAKYVPAEIITAYATLHAALNSLPDHIKSWAQCIAVLVLWILTPFYFKWIATPAEQPSLRTQQVVSFFSFIIWVYNFGGKNSIFGDDLLCIYYEPIGVSIMVIFTLISAGIIPKKD